MNLLRLTDVATPIARVCNVCATVSGSTNPVVRRYVNEAEARLVPKGKWVNTIQSYRICTNDSCLVWPRQIETIEAWALCNSPGTVRNRWYEFAGNGPGVLKESSNWYLQLIDKDPVCAFDEINQDTLTKKIQVVSDYTEAAGLRILLLGYDQNAKWITSIDGGKRIDGEYVTISTTATLSTNFFSKLVRVQKPITSGAVRLFEYETATLLQVKQLAYYEADETLPWYRKSFLPGIANQSSCDCNCDQPSTCKTKFVTVMAKLRHIDVLNDNDFLLLGNLGALKLMVQAILKEERNLLTEAVGYEAKAIKELQDELNSYEGDGAIPILKTEDRETYGGAVLNVVGNTMFGTSWM